MRVLALITAAVLSSSALLAQQPASPVGGWIATHTQTDSLELWWHFFDDHTIVATAGQITREQYTLLGDHLTLTPSLPHSHATTYVVQLTRDPVQPSDKVWPTDHLRLTAPGTAPALYDRLPATGAIRPLTLIGVWRLRTGPDIPRPLAPIAVFRTGGTAETRVPLKTMHGTWTTDPARYKLPDYPSLPFARRGPDLDLALPPDGKNHHLYHPDDVPTSP